MGIVYDCERYLRVASSIGVQPLMMMMMMMMMMGGTDGRSGSIVMILRERVAFARRWADFHGPA